MKKILKDLIKDKRILILGYGREGRSSLELIKNIGGYKALGVSDLKDVSKDLPEGTEGFFGESYQEAIDDFDVVFKSPGIVLERPVSEYKSLITSETEVFMQAYKDRVIGITGTKGKSTTSSLMYHVLKSAGLNVLFGGNIGIPVFDLSDSVKEDTVIVLELSCHQLEYLKTSPKRAVLLNIYEDHLDHYGTRERYAEAKKNIFSHQDPGDVLYTTEETFEKENLCKLLRSKLVKISLSDAPFKDFDEIPGAKLMGAHNVLNCAFVYRIATELGVDRDTFLKALGTFEPLPHRLEKFASFEGRDFYDDSISTTTESAINAVKSVGNAGILLLGGMERNLDYSDLIRFLHASDLDHVVCMYKAGERIYDLYVKEPGGPEAVLVKDLTEAVSFAVSNLRPGKACILSPAAASYGYFKNFEERGERFKTLVSEMIKK